VSDQTVAGGGAEGREDEEDAIDVTAEVSQANNGSSRS
jgi:hypothetical protein